MCLYIGSDLVNSSTFIWHPCSLVDLVDNTVITGWPRDEKPLYCPCDCVTPLTTTTVSVCPTHSSATAKCVALWWPGLNTSGCLWPNEQSCSADKVCGNSIVQSSPYARFPDRAVCHPFTLPLLGSNQLLDSSKLFMFQGLPNTCVV